MNVLILSCGTRNKIVQYFKQELKGIGKVIATDCSLYAPALYEADKHYIVPRIDDEKYLDAVLSICKENSIKVILSLIDPELTILSRNKDLFLREGITPIISDLDIVEMCFDKYKMYEFLIRNKFKTVRSYVNKNQFYEDLKEGLIEFPVFVKPVKGSASINISKVSSIEEIELLFNREKNLMIQEFMSGKEFGADIYVDLISNEPVAIFTKEKIKMKAGETDKSLSVKDEKLFDLLVRFVNLVGFKGVIDVDIFEKDGEFYISEVNPRFGGGFPHAYESGVNIPKMIINNINGRVNPNLIGSYAEGTYMMKYNEIKMTHT